MKTITTIAERLVTLLKEQQFVTAYEELYSENATSIDPMHPQAPPNEGLAVLIEREKAFLRRVIMHSVEVSAPIYGDTHFAISLLLDLTIEGLDKKVKELCVYGVRDGKIVSQQFFMNV
ncbi:SnoaL-like domain-containing protein [Mucilaginibacter panaciglaebae]|uniref:SnoaL-like domain-containing protein n=1 Tax=Mucilaginibacter panaciglaebae TaxID=502331 RepID=A0ABP7WBN8_9SPHI